MAPEAAATDTIARPVEPLDLLLRATWLIVAIGSAWALWQRLNAIGATPLWFDESFTAVASAAPDLGTWFHLASLDSAPPLYALLMWAWPFESDLGLRAASLLLMIAAVAVAVRWKGVDRTSAWFWGALLWLWGPGLALSVNARCYTLLLLLCTLQTIAFVRALERADGHRLAWWVGAGTLAFLTHYYSAIPTATQAAMMIWRHRSALVARWRSFLPAIVGLAWFAWHLPRLIVFTRPPFAWYPLIGPGDVLTFLAFTFGATPLVAAFVVLVSGIARRPVAREIGEVAAVSVVSLLLLVAIGMARPLIVDRYLISVVPGILLSISCIARREALLAIALIAATNVPPWLRDDLAWRRAFSLEQAARELGHARRVAWWTDADISAILKPEQMVPMMVDAFARTGRTVEATWGPEVGSADALVLVYQGDRTGVADRLKAKAQCRDHRGRDTGVIACSLLHAAKITEMAPARGARSPDRR